MSFAFPDEFPCVTAALLNWSVISFVDLIAFLLVHYIAPEIGKTIF